MEHYDAKIQIKLVILGEVRKKALIPPLSTDGRPKFRQNIKGMDSGSKGFRGSSEEKL
jgi:hypothetical protein